MRLLLYFGGVKSVCFYVTDLRFPSSVAYHPPGETPCMKRGAWIPYCCAAAVLFAMGGSPPISIGRADDKSAEPVAPVSFYRQVRPILQRNCTGCHQPAKAGGKLVLTTFASTMAGGEHGAAFEAGKPDQSLLIEFISGEKPAMPKNAPPLSKDQVSLISR